VRKLLKINRGIEVRKACITEAVYTLVTQALLGVVNLMILLIIICALILSGNKNFDISHSFYTIKY